MNQDYIHYSDIKISNSIDMKFEQWIFFYFIFLSLDSARIRRYFRLNLLVSRCSIWRKVYSKLQDKRSFQYLSFSLIPEHKKINLDIYLISNLYLYKYIYKSDHGFMYQIFSYRGIRSFCFVPTMWREGV